MGWIVIIVVGIVIFSIVSAGNKAKEAQEKNEFSTRTTERTLAYRDFLRRTSENPEINAMTDNELNEFIATNIRDFNKQMNDTKNGAAVLYGGSIFVAIMVLAVTEEPGAAMMVLMTLIFITAKLAKKEKAKIIGTFSAKGLHPDRLTIETT